MMGVINITPDSFSDGGKYTSLDSIKNQIDHFRKYNCKCFDFGAESTAPFNSAITESEEQSRLEPLFDLIKANEFKNDEILSFDTYKLSTFRKIISLIRDLGHKNRIIFNDVSGFLEEDLFSLMNEYEFDYVYSHSLVPSREKASDHMDYLSDEVDLASYFLEARAEFDKRNVLDRVIFDPCFGFSKTANQNLDLIEKTGEWIEVADKWLLGISRKSFLRALSPSEDKEEQVFFSELIHGQVVGNWMLNIHDKDIFIRVHNPSVFLSAQFVK